MTQIHSGLPLPAASATPGAAKASPAQPDAWLKELERARWDAQPRYQAAQADAGGQGARQQPAADASQAVARAARQEAIPQPAARHGDGPPGPRAAVLELPVSTQALLARGATVQPLAAGWLATPLAAESLQPALLRALRAVRGSRPGEPWTERNVHVQAEGDAWSVWIRDAGITPQRVQEVLDALERLAGEAGARRAVRLTVNGQPYTAAPEPNRNPQRAGERLGN